MTTPTPETNIMPISPIFESPKIVFILTKQQSDLYIKHKPLTVSVASLSHRSPHPLRNNQHV